jgi:hypothetical protein
MEQRVSMEFDLNYFINSSLQNTPFNLEYEINKSIINIINSRKSPENKKSELNLLLKQCDIVKDNIIQTLNDVPNNVVNLQEYINNKINYDEIVLKKDINKLDSKYIYNMNEEKIDFLQYLEIENMDNLVNEVNSYRQILYNQHMLIKYLRNFINDDKEDVSMDDIEKNYKNLDKIENNINDLDKRFDNKISTLYDKFSEIDKKATNTETLLNVANKKIENNHKDIVAKIENNHKDIVAKIEAINSNINEIGTRISTVETKIEIENTQKDRKFRQLIYPLISGIIVGIVVFTMNKIFK